MPLLSTSYVSAFGAGLLSAFFGATARAETSVDTDVGTDVIATNDESNLGCDVDYDRQTSLAVRPTEKQRDLTIAGVALGRGRIGDDNSIQPIEANGKATVDYLYGEHKLNLALGAAYTNEQLWGCAATVAAQLQRQHDIQNKFVLPGNSLHTRTGHVAYSYGRAPEKWTLTFDTAKQTGDQEAYTNTLDARVDLASRDIKTDAVVGSTVQTGNFDNFTEVHISGGVHYKPERPWELGLETQLAMRNTSEQRATTTAASLIRLSRTLSEHSSLSDLRVRHSEIASERQAETGLLYTGKVWDFDSSANRVIVDDPARHNSDFYKGKIGYRLSKKQKLTVQGSYGSEQPTLERFMSSLGAGYTGQLGSDASRPGHGTPRVAFTATYLATRLIDYNNYSYTVRQVHIGFLATF